MFRYLFLYFIKVKWLAESFNANDNTVETKFKCYYDQKTIPDSKRIEIWREFKYPSQCQERIAIITEVLLIFQDIFRVLIVLKNL